MVGIGAASQPGPFLLGGAALFLTLGLSQLSLCHTGHSIIEFGVASVLLGGGLWFFIEWIDVLDHALTPGVLAGLVLLGAGWNQVSAAGRSPR
ncbi:MAG: hypothetical protein L3J97_07410 [Thermoplasmata archaeon]|nr:hypothetical protein [Thermoplasmata archaeon]